MKKMRVLGYRNVWFRFHPFDSQIMVPVSFSDFAHLHDSFETCFVSQKDAEFPSPEYNGPFSHVAQRNQVEQRKQFGTLLGEEFFFQERQPCSPRGSGVCVPPGDGRSHFRELRKRTA